ncbi:uncharacterized protein LOC113228521 [Hyposmocoma kahamanoa]|uniref:uncharacterized protein LOC113228521 n=1 Tax=Hyposmocoma kahamanoa TaxID=1477025 RepID=UPI000E6D89D9|nr:uncharacterized protein LOC113228521 [Hyposmocoma kahamanoa]
METDKMSTASSVTERRPLLQALVIERRILFGCTIFVGLCTFVWIGAVCSEKWVVVDAQPGIYVSNNECLRWSESGVWKMCRSVFRPDKPLNRSTTSTTAAPVPAAVTPTSRGLHNSTTTRTPPALICTLTEETEIFLVCTNYLSAESDKLNNDPAFKEVPNFVRTMVSFGIIGLFVMAMGCGFSVYTFMNPRYMFKRLAAGIHFITTSCTFVVVQVMMSTVDYLHKNVKAVYPPQASHYYHVSFVFAWFVVLTNLFAAASFLWYSRKRKGDKAATDELAMADEPTIIGR